MAKLLLLVMAIMLCVGLVAPGCDSASIQSLKDTVQKLTGQADQVQISIAKMIDQKQAIDRAILDMPEGPRKDQAIAMSEDIGEAISTGQKWLGPAQATLERYKAELADATDSLDVADASVKAVAPMLPPPFNLLLTGVGGLVIGLIRAAQNRKAGRNIAASAEPFIVNGFTADGIGESVKADMRKAQGSTGNRIVDEAQGKKFAMPF